ncbi:hypothetical protein B6U60_08795, partial [Ligilactobacillus salivarius]
MNNEKNKQITKQVPHYGLRKLSVGVVSVLLSTTFFMGTQIVISHADTTGIENPAEKTQPIATNDNSSNGDQPATNEASQPVTTNDNSSNSDQPATNETSQSVATNDNLSNSDQPAANETSQPVTTNDNSSNSDQPATNESNSSTCNNQSLPNETSSVPSQSEKVSKQTNTLALDQLPSSSKAIFFEGSLASSSISAKPVTFTVANKIKDWQYQDKDGVVTIYGYQGSQTSLTIPNAADFVNAGLTDVTSVQISANIMHMLANTRGVTEISISKTDGKKVIASDADWHEVFMSNQNMGHYINSSSSSPEHSGNLNNYNLTKLDLTNLDTHNVINMMGLFANEYLTQINGLETWDTSNVTDMSAMFDMVSFYHQSALKQLDLSHFNTQNVTNFRGMFTGLPVTAIGNISNWNTSSAQDMSQMFSGTKLTFINLSNWKINDQTNLKNMFPVNNDVPLVVVANDSHILNYDLSAQSRLRSVLLEPRMSIGQNILLSQIITSQTYNQLCDQIKQAYQEATSISTVNHYKIDTSTQTLIKNLGSLFNSVNANNSETDSVNGTNFAVANAIVQALNGSLWPSIRNDNPKVVDINNFKLGVQHLDFAHGQSSSSNSFDVKNDLNVWNYHIDYDIPQTQTIITKIGVPIRLTDGIIGSQPTSISYYFGNHKINYTPTTAGYESVPFTANYSDGSHSNNGVIQIWVIDSEPLSIAKGQTLSINQARQVIKNSESFPTDTTFEWVDGDTSQLGTTIGRVKITQGSTSTTVPITINVYGEDEETDTYYREIYIKDPEQTTFSNPVKQTATIYRTKNVDKEGHITYTPWSDIVFPEYEVPRVDGYVIIDSLDKYNYNIPSETFTVDDFGKGTSPVAKSTYGSAHTIRNYVGYTKLENVLRTIKQSIQITLPNGDIANADSIVQFRRNATMDMVTNKITYGNWNAYDVDSTTGKIIKQISSNPSFSAFDALKDVGVPSTYTAHINDLNHNTEINGHILPEQNVTPDSINSRYAVTYTENHSDRTETKTVTRTIKIINPDGSSQTIEQPVTLTRHIDHNDVTGLDTPGAWSTGNWSSFIAPVIPGYLADKVIPETIVNGQTADVMIIINYQAQDQNITIKYVDQNSNVVKTINQTGKTGETIAPKYADPNGYDIV